MNYHRQLILLAISAAFVTSAGCASSSSSQSFTPSQTRTAFSVHYGEVISAREVEIEGEATFVGRFGGAWIGYALGRGDSDWYTNPPAESVTSKLFT